MIDTIFRSLIMYVALIVVLRIMGKREIGQLTPFDLVVAIVLAELAAIPMEQKNIKIWEGLVPIGTLLLAELVVAWSSLKSITIRRLVNGTPTIVIDRGQIVEQNLRRGRYTINDVLAQLREKGYANLDDVEYAVLETSGRLSVIPKAQKRPVTPGDLNIDVPIEYLPLPLIIDGVVLTRNLITINRDLPWLEKQIASFTGGGQNYALGNHTGRTGFQNILLASWDGYKISIYKKNTCVKCQNRV